MNVLRKVLSISAAILLLSATAKAQDAGNGAEQQRLFDYPEVPDTIITLENRTNYIIQNFWNDYDFSQPIRDEWVFEATFRDYVTFFKYAHKTIVVSCIKDMMRKAQSNKSNFLLIAEIAERTLYDPGAEYWSDEVYIPFLESVLDNNMLKKSEQERYKYQLELLRNNLMGDRAQNFELRLADGSKKKLSEIEGKMLLVFFNDEECEENLWLMKESEIPDHLEKICGSSSDDDFDPDQQLLNMTPLPPFAAQQMQYIAQNRQ